jgi:hypothetical protein
MSKMMIQQAGRFDFVQTSAVDDRKKSCAGEQGVVHQTQV